MAIESLLALWMGILATASPCPLASNVAALSYLLRSGMDPRKTLFVSASYACGRIFAYGVLGALLIFGLSSAPEISSGLQRSLPKLSGPLFLVVGVLLLGWLELPAPTSFREKITRKAASDTLGAFFLGFFLALLPCPETAALFFGGLLPLALHTSSFLLYPSLFGLGTGLPVIALGILFSSGMRALSSGLLRFYPMEHFLQLVTGWVFLCVGLYFTLAHIYHIF